MIELRDVTKRFGKRTAVSRVSTTLRAGEITLLLGANGAGKSTLLRCLLGVTDFEGSITICGLDPIADGPAARAQIGYMPQSGGLHPDLTVEETLRFYAEIRRVPASRCDALLSEAMLADHRAVRVGDLSGGMKQRLGFAIALLTDPRILVLDEPSASLDTASRAWLVRRLQACAADGRLVLVSTHATHELVDTGFRRLVLEDGCLVSDTLGTGAGSGGEAADLTRAVAGSLRPIVRKELHDAIRNRWLIGYTALLAVLGLAATATGVGSSSGLGLQAFGRTTATLMNMCLLLAPLVAVLMGAAAVAGERERGTLDHLLAQPIGGRGLLLAKHAGLLIALAGATIAGFLPAGVLIGSAAGPGVIGHYLVFPAIATLAAAAMCGIGLYISVSSRTAVQAQGTAIFAWFAAVLLYDLVLVGALATSGVPAPWLAASLAANPVDAARVLGVLALEPDLYLLGPAGSYLTTRLTPAGAASVLLVALMFWAGAPLLAAVIRFIPRRRTHHVSSSVVPERGNRARRERGVLHAG